MMYIALMVPLALTQSVLTSGHDTIVIEAAQAVATGEHSIVMALTYFTSTNMKLPGLRLSINMPVQRLSS